MLCNMDGQFIGGRGPQIFISAQVRALPDQICDKKLNYVDKIHTGIQIQGRHKTAE